MTRVLGIDLGGGSLRAGLVGRDGALLDLVARPLRVTDEIEPEIWWRALLGLLDALDLQGVQGVALSGFGRSQVFVDAAGMPLRPAICFTDTRAGAIAAELADAARGTWTPMSAWHPLARIAWVARHEPAVFRRTRMVLAPKDWLGLRLTGQAASDRPGNAWALDGKGLARSLAPFRRARIDPALLPILRDPWERLGTVRGIPALEGVPVMVGALDTWCATLGAGVGAGEGYILSGTTDVAGVLAAEPLEAEGRLTLPWGGGLFHSGGPATGGGACLDWLADTLGLPGGDVVAAMAAQARAEAGGNPPPLFLPGLSGLRAPHWQPGARGGFIGLRTEHRAPDLALAVLEGVALADAAALSGLPATRIVLAGGGARSDLWCRIRAGTLGREVERAAAPEAGVLGAALLAWIGVGALADLDAARALAAGGAELFAPMPGAPARYAALLRLQTAAQETLGPVFDKLGAIPPTA